MTKRKVESVQDLLRALDIMQAAGAGLDQKSPQWHGAVDKALSEEFELIEKSNSSPEREP